MNLQDEIAKKLQESIVRDQYKLLDEPEKMDIEGIVDGILVVTDPEITADEYDEIIDRAEEVVEDTPEGELPFSEDYIGNYIQMCPICGQSFITPTIKEVGDACPVCLDTPEAFVLLGRLNSTGDEAEKRGFEETEETEEASPVPDTTESSLGAGEDEEGTQLDLASKQIPQGTILTESYNTDGFENSEDLVDYFNDLGDLPDEVEIDGVRYKMDQYGNVGTNCYAVYTDINNDDSYIRVYYTLNQISDNSYKGVKEIKGVSDLRESKCLTESNTIQDKANKLLATINNYIDEDDIVYLLDKLQIDYDTYDGNKDIPEEKLDNVIEVANGWLFDHLEGEDYLTCIGLVDFTEEEKDKYGINSCINEITEDSLNESKVLKTEENTLPNITWILDEYETETATKEQLGSDYYYRTLCTSVNDAEKFNYHSDYWGDAEEYQESKKLQETGEWDDNDEEMSAWKEDLQIMAEELASQINGEVKVVKGFDKYQGPFAIVNTPNHGDIELWYDGEDDTGRTFVAKVAHFGWIQGDVNKLAELLNKTEIPETEKVNESKKVESTKETEITINKPISTYIKITDDREQWDYPMEDIDEARANNEYLVIDNTDKRVYEVTEEEFGMIKNNLTENKLEETVTLEEMEDLRQRLDYAEDVDEIQDIIFSITDDVLENEVQLAFDQSIKDGDEFEVLKDYVTSVLEDNAEYED